MRRFHLFEWEDQPWLPTVFRDFITDHLRYGLTQKMRRPLNFSIATRLKSLLARDGGRQIVDLCAGAGGPLLLIQRILTEDLDVPVEVLLTDLYPNIQAFQQREAEGLGTVTARYESTSAFDVPTEIRGLRTLFTALHHFRPEQVRLILIDAVRKGQSIAIFEPLERTLRMVFLIGVDALRRSFLLTPRVGRFTFPRFLWTYIVPLAPAIMFWDGIVSALRTYTPAELTSLAQSIPGATFQWEAGQFERPGPLGISMPTIFLVGYPIDVPKSEVG